MDNLLPSSIEITGSIFLLVFVGYIAVSLKLFSSKDMDVLGKYVINIAVPAIMFHAVINHEFSQTDNFGFMGGYLIGSLMTLSFGLLIGLFVMKLSPIQSLFNGMGMSYSNTIYMGYPTLLLLMPSIAPTALVMCVIVEAIVLIPIILIASESLSFMVLLGTLLNPMLIALTLGVIVSVTNLDVPSVITQPIDFIAKSGAAVSLIAIGGMCARLSPSLFKSRVLLIIIGKLIIHPLFVFTGVMIMGVIGFPVTDYRLIIAAIIMSAMPPMTIYPILAQKYGEGNIATAAFSLMIILSFLTINIILTVSSSFL